ncbi:MAG TPA: HEAT repeat domain-containing protein [Tepidisphaeraceae bacterium]|nr:HEAT repeat domain-containing protein [Tepidisphaeraceae bacterium]
MNRKFQICLAAVVLCAGCQQVERAGTFGKNVLDFMRGKTPINAAKRMEDQYFADERRIGIAELANRDFGRRDPYVTRYEQIAQLDADWMVRATAIRALNRSRDSKATGIFIHALSDDNPIVRVEACKALANIPDPAATPILVRLVSNTEENHDVRIWAADALRHYRQLEVARTLANQLNTRDFGVAWQARKSLVSLTGRDLKYDESAWLQYLTGNNAPFG